MEMEDNDVMRLNDEERAAIDKARKIGVDDSKNNNTNNNCGELLARRDGEFVCIILIHVVSLFWHFFHVCGKD